MCLQFRTKNLKKFDFLDAQLFNYKRRAARSFFIRRHFPNADLCNFFLFNHNQRKVLDKIGASKAEASLAYA